MANVPAAVVLLTAQAVGTRFERASTFGIETSQEQLQRTGLATDDFAAVSCVKYSGAVLQPEMLDVTMSMMDSSVTPGTTLLLSNLPLDLEAFQEAGTLS